MTEKILKDLIVIASSTILITLAIWIPHIFRMNFYNLNFSNGFDGIYRNFDGLEYIIIAKSFYNPEIIKQLPQHLPVEYYAAYFPGFALFILLFAPLLGFLKSMLFVSLLFTVLSAIAFYFLVKDFKLTLHPLYLSLIFLILPARWLIVHSVGSAEPMFIFFLIATIYFFMKFEENHKPLFLYASGIFGFLTQFTRPPGILIFVAFILYLLWKLIFKEKELFFKKLFKLVLTYFPLLLIPFSLLLVFYWYHLIFNDFFAYFHSGDNIHLSFPPFQVFNKNQFWVGEIWLEDIVYILLLTIFGSLLLIKQKLFPIAFFTLTYILATVFVAHRDISRYILPVFPFMLIAFEKVLVSKEFKIALLLISLGIYLYAQNFLIENIAPVSNIGALN